MISKFRILALAAMSLAAAMSAQAAPTVINIDFEALADDAKKDGKPAKITKEKDFSFAGATVFHETQTTRGAGYCCTAPTGHTGFIQTREGKTANSKVNKSIVIELDGALAGGDIESLTFDAATASTDLEFQAFDGQGNMTKFDFNPSAAAWTWVGQTLNFAHLGAIKRIEFVNLGGPSAVFALDNLAFTLASPGGGTVPEPAGLGLVALALAAAGLTVRKRRA